MDTDQEMAFWKVGQRVQTPQGRDALSELGDAQEGLQNCRRTDKGNGQRSKRRSESVTEAGSGSPGDKGTRT